jgi:hypothetical protein
LRAFGSAMLMIGAVLSAFATAFAGQCVFADPVEPGSEATAETVRAQFVMPSGGLLFRQLSLSTP